MERLVRDRRAMKEASSAKEASSFINQDTRKAMIYIQLQAEKNIRQEKGLPETAIIDLDKVQKEKKHIAREALASINEVIITLEKEYEYNPIRVLGVIMKPSTLSLITFILFCIVMLMIQHYVYSGKGPDGT